MWAPVSISASSGISSFILVEIMTTLHKDNRDFFNTCFFLGYFSGYVSIFSHPCNFFIYYSNPFIGVFFLQFSKVLVCPFAIVPESFWKHYFLLHECILN